jgi:arylsulfate sulfotransferase
MNPTGRTPLAGLLTFRTNEPARATLVVDDGEDGSTATPTEALATEHELMVLGLRPDRVNRVTIELTDGDGRKSVAATLDAQTPPLPAHLPSISVVTSRPAAMEPGVTLVQLFRWPNREPDLTYGLIVGLDPRGDVVWLLELDVGVDEPRRLANGNLLMLAGRGRGMLEVDMLGRIVRRWHPAGTTEEPAEGSLAVATDTFHHDVVALPNENFLVLSTEVRELADYPTSETDPAAPKRTRNVIGDVLVEFAPDGTVVKEWKFLDLLDPYRLGYNSLSTGFYADIYDHILPEPAPDWMHANGLHYDAPTDAIYVSSNHLSIVVKIERGSDRVRWMLGDPQGWREPWSGLLLEPVGELSWSYHHHSPEWTPQGTLLLYDNGAVRAIPPDPPRLGRDTFSRVVEYAIDEAAGTVREIWSYGGPGSDWFLSGFISDSDTLPQTGNVLLTNGGQVKLADGSPGTFPFEGRLWITLTEITHTTPAEKVWEVVIEDPAMSWASYRAERVPSLYP